MAKSSKKKSKPKKTASHARAKSKSAARPAKKTSRAKKSAPVSVFISKTVKPIPIPESREKPLTPSQVQEFRETLVDKRELLLAVVQRKKEQEIEAADTEVIGDEADIATRSVEKEMLFELTDSEKQTLDMIEAALRKMEKGVYGFCESCQKPIGRLRMEVMPWVRYCIHCQAEHEVPPPVEI
ncbi:MAG TPA: TraR/DksA family transcriptional regulator [Elusimicrobiota bacterium]|nr:TraR/DksA family transcriptional regulator [Elusimicrobiota bacterium]